MRKLLRWLLLTGAVMTLLCVSALAAEPTEAGMYRITGSGATLDPQTATGTDIAENNSNTDYTGYYANAARFGVSTTGTVGSQYLLLVTKGAAGTAPTVSNIVYIDQAAADSSGGVTFNAYPSTLAQGHYCVYVVGTDKAYSAASPAAEFDTYQPYTLGDVNDDEKININDAMAVIYHIVGKQSLTETQQMAANVVKGGMNDAVNINDAMQIIYFIVGKIAAF